MDNAPNQQGQFYVIGSGPSTRKIFLPDGYKLADYTLRRVHDEYPQSYVPVDGSVTPVQAQLSDLQSHGGQQTTREDSIAASSAPNAFTSQSPYSTPIPNQQLYNIPIRGGPNSFAIPDPATKGLSKKTQKRYAHSRDDNYTDVCNVYSPEKSIPVKKYNHGKGEFCCPRCGSNYTRPKTVKDHFPDCVSKCGNPDSLRYTDHPSMAEREARIQRRGRASREASSLDKEKIDYQTAEEGQMVKVEEMNDAFDDTSIPDIADRAPDDDGPHIKTEFVFGADIAHESIETQSLEQQSQSANLGLRHTSVQLTLAGGRCFISQTPDWTRPDSSTPSLDTIPWNMRTTTLQPEWTPAAKTPTPTNGDVAGGRCFISQTPDWTRPDSSTPSLDTIPWNMRTTTLQPEWTPAAKTPTPTNGDVAGGRCFISQTPDWTRRDTSTPSFDTLPWSTRDTTLQPEWTPAAGTPEPTSGDGYQSDGLSIPRAGTPTPTNDDGYQGDGLDPYKDRRSVFSETPEPYGLVDRRSVYSATPAIDEECEMEG